MEVLPSSKAGCINNRPDNFTELWSLPSGKLHKHPSEKQKPNLQTQLRLRMSRNPFPTQPPRLSPLFQISPQGLENTFGFRLGFGLLGDLPHGNCPTPSWQLSPGAPSSLFPELPWATQRVWLQCLPGVGPFKGEDLSLVRKNSDNAELWSSQ